MSDVKNPLERDLEELVCWVNCWGDERNHNVASRDWHKGYQKAMLDMLPRVQALAPDWLDTWRKRYSH